MVIEFDIDYNRARYSVDGGKTWRNIGSCEGINCYDAQKEFYSKILGRWESDWKNKYKTKEEKDMNKVLELYVEREEKRIKDKYTTLEDEMYNNEPVVKAFAEVQKTYAESMEELRTAYNTIDKVYIVKTGYKNFDTYELSNEVRSEIHEKLVVDFDKEMKELHNKKEDVNALLSLSDDKDYQVEVLTKYGILDKKGLMIA